MVRFHAQILGCLLAAAVRHSVAADDPPALSWTQFPPLPDRLGVAGAFAGVSSGELLVGGGANFPDRMPWDGGQKVWRDTVYALAGSKAAWRIVGRLTRPLAYGVSLTTPRGVLCLGGADAERAYADATLLSWSKDRLETTSLPPLPLPLASAAGALVDHTAFVACGTDRGGEQRALNRVFSLDILTPGPAWQELPPCPGEARILPAAAAAEGALYLAGGAALRALDGKIRRVYLQDCWRFTRERRWERLADLPSPCVAAPSPAPIINGRLLLLGGDDGSRTGFQPLDRHPGFPGVLRALDLRSGQWTAQEGLPAPRAVLPAVEWNGWFVFPSGEVRPGVRSPEVWACRP